MCGYSSQGVNPGAGVSTQRKITAFWHQNRPGSVNKVKGYHPQQLIDRQQNVWILKPGVNPGAGVSTHLFWWKHWILKPSAGPGSLLIWTSKWGEQVKRPGKFGENTGFSRSTIYDAGVSGFLQARGPDSASEMKNRIVFLVVQFMRCVWIPRTGRWHGRRRLCLVSSS